MNQPAPTQQTSATVPGKARVIEFSVDPHVTLDPCLVPGYSEDLSCREREDILDEAEWALENEAEPEDATSGQSRLNLSYPVSIGPLDMDGARVMYDKPTPF